VSGCDEWVDKILPRLKKIPTYEVVRLTGLSRSYVKSLKNGKRNPSAETVEKIKTVMDKEGR